MQQKYQIVLSLVAACFVSQAFAGSNFTIGPKAGTTLPTSIVSGGSVTAYYTVLNNTHSTRTGYSVRGLPATVVHVTGAGLCTKPITLAAGASCTLQLDISAAIHSGFAICKGSTCTSAAVPLDVSASALSPFIAAGGYNNGTSYVPLIANSFDGVNWAYTLTGSSVLPSLIPTRYLAPISPVLTTGQCYNANCIAVGRYPIGTIVLARSIDGGKNWTFPISGDNPGANQPVDLQTGQLRTQNCSGSVCVAAGVYSDLALNNPILASSQNNGASWTYYIDGPSTALQIPGYDRSNSGFLSVSCSSAACIAAGSYSSLDIYPMIAAGNASGLGWNYTVYEGVQLPGDLVSGRYFGSYCMGSTCFASGTYETLTLTYPLIGRSADGGITWNYPVTSASMPSGINDYDTNGNFNKITCHGTTCIAAGRYRSTLAAVMPWIVTSNDSGVTWTTTLSSETEMLGDVIEGGRINAISCSDNICIAAGFYDESSDTFPLVATSKDGGQTWVYTLNKSLALPDNSVMVNGALAEAQCSGLVCTVSGTYNDGVNDFPLLASSLDGGTTWAYKVYGAFPVLQPYDGGGYLGLALVS